MKLTAARAIPLALVIALAGLIVSGIPRYRDAHHGLDYLVGQTAWLVFLAGALAVIVLTAVAVTRRLRRTAA